MRRLLPTTVLVGALALVATACFPNGQLPEDSLQVITPTCRVVADVAAPLRSMLDAAQAAGVGLQPETRSYLEEFFPGVEPPRNESCYRSYEMQVWWRNFYCFIGACQYAAVPGTSIHGWGRAVDFEDQGGELTFDSPGYQWLQTHAADYGFFHPAWAEPGGSSPEPWHWEHG